MARIYGILAARAAERLTSMEAAAIRGYAGPATSVRNISSAPHVALGVRDVLADRFGASVDGVDVVIDGHVYNRAELGSFATDAELIAHLYRKHGFEGMLALLNGDYAIALFDSRSDTLWMARDRLGVKPLYYSQAGDWLAFASRPAQLLDLPGVGRNPNRRFAAVFAAAHYRYFDNVPEESPYERVSQLPAAHWLMFSRGRLKTGAYWRFEDQAEFTDSESVLAERYRELLLSAVSLRHAASQRPAFTLSGGMDSSSVLASAARRAGQPQVAYSTVYTDKTFDESDEIRPMLSHAVSQWNQVRVDDPDVFALVQRMVAANDEPVATATWLSHFLLCEQAAKAGYGALFGGLGGDELNAGEYEYFFFHFADLGRQPDKAGLLNREIEQWAHHHDHPIYRKNATVAANTVARCADPAQPGRCRPDAARMQRYYGVLDRDYFDIDRFVPVMEAPFSSYLKTRTYQDLTRETAPCCLRAEDRQTQAFGLDNHVPFFDHRLVEFMFRVPGTLKIRDGVTKILLREAMRGILPEETRTRVKKTGWNAPAHLWFSGRGRAQLQDLVHSQAFRQRGIYREAEVSRIIAEHDEIVASGAQRENHMMFLWQLVNLELWLQSLQAPGR
jgi:asparagine synthase (glutamine-hydrolysing)